MKKNKIRILFLLLIVFIPNIVNARINAGSDFIHNDKVNDNSYLAICAYDYSYEYKHSSRKARINIYYVYENKNWIVSWDASAGNDNRYSDKKGTFSKVFSKTGKNIHITNADANALKKGKCPEGAWLISDGASDRVCFGSENNCDKISNTGATSQKKYDISEDISTYFTNNAPTINSCSALRDKNFNISSKMEEDFKTNFLHSHDVPSFILKSDAYTQGLETAKEKYEDFKEQCDREVTNSSLSTEEKNELIEQNQAGLDEAINQVEKFDEKLSAQLKGFIDSIESGPLSCNNLTGGNFGAFLNMVLSLIRYAVPILILALSIKDYILAITSQDAGAIKKASTSLSKRIVIGVIIFVLPTVLDFILKLAGVECGVAGL